MPSRNVTRGVTRGITRSSALSSAPWEDQMPVFNFIDGIQVETNYASIEMDKHGVLKMDIQPRILGGVNQWVVQTPAGAIQLRLDGTTDVLSWKVRNATLQTTAATLLEDINYHIEIEWYPFATNADAYLTVNGDTYVITTTGDDTTDRELWLGGPSTASGANCFGGIIQNVEYWKDGVLSAAWPLHDPSWTLGTDPNVFSETVNGSVAALYAGGVSVTNLDNYLISYVNIAEFTPLNFLADESGNRIVDDSAQYITA